MEWLLSQQPEEGGLLSQQAEVEGLLSQQPEVEEQPRTVARRRRRRGEGLPAHGTEEEGRAKNCSLKVQIAKMGDDPKSYLEVPTPLVSPSPEKMDKYLPPSSWPATVSQELYQPTSR